MSIKRYKDPGKLCDVDLTVETNAAANVKIFKDICGHKPYK